MSLGIVVALVTTLICRVFGGKLVGVRGRDGWLIGVPVGIGVVSLLWFLLSFFQIFTFLSIVLSLVGVGIVGFSEWGGTLTEMKSGLAWFRKRLFQFPIWHLEGAVIWLITLFFVLSLLQALVPATGIDVGSMHFAVPKVMIQEQGLFFRPNLFIAVGGGWHLFYAGLMAVGGETAAKLCPWGMTLLSFALLFSTTRILAGTRAGYASGFLFLMTPLVSAFSSTAFLEMPSIAFLSLPGFLLIRKKTEITRRIILGGIFVTVFAISGKISVAYGLIPAVWLGVLGLRRFGIGFGVWAVTISVVTGAYWKAWYYFSRVSDNHFPGLIDSQSEVIGGTGGFDIIYKSVTHLFFVGGQWTESVGVLYWIFLCAAAILGAWSIRGARQLFYLVGGGVLFYVIAVMSIDFKMIAYYANARYLAPALLAFGFPLVGIGLRYAWHQGRFVRVWILVFVVLFASPILVLRSGKSAAVLPVLLGRESRDEFLSRRIESYSASLWINRNISPGRSILVSVTRPYYLDPPYRKFPAKYITENFDDLLRRHNPQFILFETNADKNVDMFESFPGANRLERVFRDRRVSVYRVRER